MSNHWKYTMQKHRGKIWVGGSLLVTALVSGGLWLVVSEDSPFSETKEAVNYLADYSIMAKSDGGFDLVRVENGELVGQLPSITSKSMAYKASTDHEKLFAFDGDTLYQVQEESGELSSKVLASGFAGNTPNQFSTDGKTLAVYDDKLKTLSISDIASGAKTTIDDIPVLKDILIQNESVFYLTENEIVKVSNGVASKIEVGETLTSMQESDGNIVVHSKFGQDKGENIVLYVNSETMDIESLQKTGATNSLMLTNDDGEDFILVGHSVNGDTPSYEFVRYGIRDNRLEKDDLTLRIPIEANEMEYKSTNHVVDKDYIYMQSPTGLKVYDLKTQRVEHDIPYDVEYAMPVIIEKGDDTK